MSTCRCDGMVDVVDSKSTAGDSVPVRVRSPAPNIPQPPRGRGIFLYQMRLDSNQFNAAGPSAHDRRLHAVYIIYNIVYPTEMDPWELMAVFGDSVGAIHESPAPQHPLSS